MSTILLEHVNLTVTDAIESAELLCRLFDWKIRWQGASLDEGYTVHVGNDQQYIALYSPSCELGEKPASYVSRATLSHIGILVEKMDLVEKRLADEGLRTHSHQEYEPGRRFYFDDPDGIEFEVVSYD